MKLIDTSPLDLPRTPFEELVGLVSDFEFEDQQSESSHPEEWSDLDQLLLTEEQESESESEAEDWWISD